MSQQVKNIRYPTPVRNLLGEFTAAAALLSNTLKFDGVLSLQARGNGPLPLIMSECNHHRELRGIAKSAEPDADIAGDLPYLIGSGGALTISIHPDQGKRYQGIVPLDAPTLSDCLEHYFVQSEQIPTLLRLGIRFQGEACLAGGILVQHLPQGEVGRARLHAEMEHPDWEHVSALAGSMSHAELVDPKLSMEALIWRLFHEENKILIEKGVKLAKGCRCSVGHYDSVISRFPESERDEMRNEQGNIVVDCAFCSKEFILSL